MSPIFISELFTNGVTPVANNRANGAINKIPTIKSTPSGTFFSAYFII